jgi:hypothetical protein
MNLFIRNYKINYQIQKSIELYKMLHNKTLIDLKYMLKWKFYFNNLIQELFFDSLERQIINIYDIQKFEY